MRHGYIFFRPDNGDGAGGGAASGADGDDAGKQQQAQGQDGGQQGQDGGKVSFTAEQQAQIDALIADRVKRAEKQARQTALDEAKQQREREQMDELERVKAEKADAEAKAVEASAAAQRALVAADAKVAAIAAGAAPEKVAHIMRLADLAGIELVDGAPDAAAVKAVIEKVKADVPELFGAAGTRQSGGDFRTGDAGKRVFTSAEIRAMSPDEYAKNRDEIMAAMREGRVRD